MPTTIQVPGSIDEAIGELAGLDVLLTATEWHRAAIVATFVRLDVGRGNRKEMGDIPQIIVSARRFANYGIRGLSYHGTVVHYVQCWLNAHGGNYPARGASVVLPDTPWPPQGKNIGSRMTDNKLTEAVQEMPVAELVERLDEAKRVDVVREIAARTPPADAQRDRLHERRVDRMGAEAANADAVVEALGEGARALAHLRLMADAVHRIEWATVSDSSKRELIGTCERVREVVAIIDDLRAGLTDDELRALLAVEP